MAISHGLAQAEGGGEYRLVIDGMGLIPRSLGTGPFAKASVVITYDDGEDLKAQVCELLDELLEGVCEC